jgi:putative membrane protein
LSRLSDSELVIQDGLLWREERRIPVSRIQRLDLRQSAIHRLLGLARLEISTAGSEQREAVLDVVSRRQADALKQALTAAQTGDRSVTPAASEAGRTLARLPFGLLVRGGLTSRVAATLVALVGVIFYFTVVAEIGSVVFRGVDPRAINPIANWERSLMPGHGTILEPVTEFLWDDTLVKSVLFILAGFLLALARYVVRYAHFALTESGGVLTKAQGLLKLETSTLARARIQALKVEEGLLRRCFGLADIWVDSGGDRNKADDQKKRIPLVPVLSKAQVGPLVCDLLPGLEYAAPPWRMVSPKAVLRGSKKGWLVVLAAMAIAVAPFGWFTLAYLPAFPLIYLLNVQWYRNTGYWIDDRYLISRKGWFNRQTLYLPVRNIQNVTLTESPFDRRLELASVTIDTAGQTNTGGGATIRNLPIQEARRIQQTLALNTGRFAPPRN